MKTQTILGHINCPTCGKAQGMRITPDKNGDPFGYCATSCRQQLRIGGDEIRVAAFLKLHPWAAAVPVTVTEPLPTPLPEPLPVTAGNSKPVTAPQPQPLPTKKKASWADGLAALGVR